MKKFKIISFCILVVFITASILFLANKSKKEEKKENQTNYIMNEQTVDNNIYDKDGNAISLENKKTELSQIPKEKLIQGIVELKRDDTVYIFNGQHFGEFGFEMEECTMAYIDTKNQKCIDYVTHYEHNADYIEQGDILIFSRNALKKENKSDTNVNKFIVLKAENYEVMKREALTNKRESITTVGAYYDNDRTLYLKYSLSDGDYQFPFIIQVTLSDDVKVLGKLEEGITVKVQYKDINVPLDELEVQAIEIVEY